MDASQKQSWEVASTEYEAALEQYRHFTGLRRQDMLFVTAIQGAALTIIGGDLLHMKAAYIALSCIAFVVILLGMNSERRLTAYMGSYARRARVIESQHGMTLVSDAYASVQGCRFMFSNARVFLLFYVLLLLAWLVIWIVNVCA